MLDYPLFLINNIPFPSPLTPISSSKNEDRLCDSLAVLLEKESQSAVFEEGISYALFKVSERGLACAAEVLLRYGADLNFEGNNNNNGRWPVRRLTVIT